MKTNEKGFGIVQILLLLVLVGLIGGTGFYVNKAQKDTNKSLDNASENLNELAEPNTSNVPRTEAEEESWLLYESPGKEYTIRLADGWEMQRYQDSPSIYSFDHNKIQPLPGKKAVVTQVQFGRDGTSVGLFISYATENLDQIYTPGEKQTSLRTKDGLEIEKYTYTEKEDIEGIGSLPKDGSQYTYVIRKGSNQLIVVSYGHSATDADYHATVEKAVVTTHFSK